MKRNRVGAVVITILLCAMLLSCRTAAVKAPVPLPSGFVNEYDAQVFDALYTASASILEAKKQFGANPAAKAPLNAAIAAYRDAKAGYLTWHNASMVNPAADHSSLDNLLNIMVAAIAVINQQFPASPGHSMRNRVYSPELLEAL